MRVDEPGSWLRRPETAWYRLTLRMNNSPGIRMKFCESLDRFVAIRTFTPQQRTELFQNVKINDKKSYKRLIINAAVVNYLDEIAPSLSVSVGLAMRKLERR